MQTGTSELLLKIHRPSRPNGRSNRNVESRATNGVVVGSLIGVDAEGVPYVDFPQNRSGGPIPARTTVALASAEAGADVVLLFEAGDASRPLVLGKLIPPSGTAAIGVVRDGGCLTLSAEKQITLTCGEASITLTSCGKVLIKGAYVLSRSTGVNRVKGGSVQIN